MSFSTTGTDCSHVYKVPKRRHLFPYPSSVAFSLVLGFSDAKEKKHTDFWSKKLLRHGKNKKWKQPRSTSLVSGGIEFYCDDTKLISKTGIVSSMTCQEEKATMKGFMYYACWVLRELSMDHDLSKSMICSNMCPFQAPILDGHPFFQKLQKQHTFKSES